MTIDPATDVERTQEALEIFKSEYDDPDIVIAYGRCAGGHVARAIAEVHPETTDGTVALCPTTWFLTANQIFDFIFIMKQLLAEEKDSLSTHSIPPDEVSVMRNRWQNVLEAAKETTAGRARISMAFALAQYPSFGGHSTADTGVAKPDYGGCKSCRGRHDGKRIKNRRGETPPFTHRRGPARE